MSWPAPAVTLAVAPPVIVMLLSGPASTVQFVLPAHDEVQFVTHVEPPAQVVVLRRPVTEIDMKCVDWIKANKV